jgi:hypothetical protein
MDCSTVKLLEEDPKVYYLSFIAIMDLGVTEGLETDVQCGICRRRSVKF